MVCLVVGIQQQAYLHFDHFGFVDSLKNCATIPNCIEYMKVSILLEAFQPCGVAQFHILEPL